MPKVKGFKLNPPIWEEIPQDKLSEIRASPFCKVIHAPGDYVISMRILEFTPMEIKRQTEDEGIDWLIRKDESGYLRVEFVEYYSVEQTIELYEAVKSNYESDPKYKSLIDEMCGNL